MNRAERVATLKGLFGMQIMRPDLVPLGLVSAIEQKGYPIIAKSSDRIVFTIGTVKVSIIMKDSFSYPMISHKGEAILLPKRKDYLFSLSCLEKEVSRLTRSEQVAKLRSEMTKA